ncbi:MAG TPA: aromatic-ring-hydroxylating dioxygenase subunit beta [Alphaproteobacteria bacterium]
MAKKTKKPRRKAAALRIAKSRSAAKSKPAPSRKPASPAADPRYQIEQLLYRQAEALDSKDWQGFIELFTDDGVYWMPADASQTTGDGVPSIFYEDRDLMTVRMRRLGHPRAWSQKTEWGTNHVVSNVVIDKLDPKTGAAVVRSRFHMMEFRNDATRHFAGSYLHHLTKAKDGYRVKRQRVDMVNAQGPYDYVLQAWV